MTIPPNFHHQNICADCIYFEASCLNDKMEWVDRCNKHKYELNVVLWMENAVCDDWERGL